VARKAETLPPPPKTMSDVYRAFDHGEITAREARLLLKAYTKARTAWLDQYFEELF
jgi:hypothetical protein